MLNFLKRKSRKPIIATPKDPLVIDCSVRGDVKLGDEAKDKVTGFTGIVNYVSHEIDGTMFIGLQPQGLSELGTLRDSMEFDIEHIEVIRPGAVKVHEHKSTMDKVKIGAMYEDRVSGFKGVAVNVMVFLGGCVRVHLRGKVDKDNKRPDPVMVPVESLILLDDEPAKVAEKKKTKTGGPGKNEAKAVARIASRAG